MQQGKLGPGNLQLGESPAAGKIRDFEWPASWLSPVTISLSNLRDERILKRDAADLNVEINLRNLRILAASLNAKFHPLASPNETAAGFLPLYLAEKHAESTSLPAWTRGKFANQLLPLSDLKRFMAATLGRLAHWQTLSFPINLADIEIGADKSVTEETSSGLQEDVKDLLASKNLSEYERQIASNVVTPGRFSFFFFSSYRVFINCECNQKKIQACSRRNSQILVRLTGQSKC
jgi:hypothetical protein